MIATDDENKPTPESTKSRPASPGRENTPSADAEAEIAERGIAERGGPSGPEPTRYGDWERKGRCIDF